MFSGGLIAEGDCDRPLQAVACDSGPESESATFYHLQLRLQLQTKQSTPTDSNSGLDSDSAALVKTALVLRSQTVAARVGSGSATWN